MLYLLFIPIILGCLVFGVFAFMKIKNSKTDNEKAENKTKLQKYGAVIGGICVLLAIIVSLIIFMK